MSHAELMFKLNIVDIDIYQAPPNKLLKISSIFQHLFQNFTTFHQNKLTRFYFQDILIEFSSCQWWSNKNFSFSRTHVTGPRRPFSRILGTQIDIINVFLLLLFQKQTSSGVVWTSLNLYHNSEGLTL